MPNHRNSRANNEETGLALALIVGLLLLAVTGGIAIEAWLLYLPVKGMSRGNGGRVIALIGVTAIVAGSVILAYQIFVGDESLDYMSRITALPRIILFFGVVLYLLGLAAAFFYRSRLKRFQSICRSLASKGELSPIQVDAAREFSRKIGVSLVDSEEVIYLENHVNALAILEAGGMPISQCPNNIRLGMNEECYVVLVGAALCKDVFGTQYTAQGNTTYFRLSDRITIAPSNYTAKSMPTKELQTQDVGHLLMTNQRVLFQGDTFRLDYPYQTVEGVSEYVNGFQLHFAGKSERQIFRTQGVDARLAASLIRKLAMPHR